MLTALTQTTAALAQLLVSPKSDPSPQLSPANATLQGQAMRVGPLFESAQHFRTTMTANAGSHTTPRYIINIPAAIDTANGMFIRHSSDNRPLLKDADLKSALLMLYGPTFSFMTFACPMYNSSHIRIQANSAFSNMELFYSLTYGNVMQLNIDALRRRFEVILGDFPSLDIKLLIRKIDTLLGQLRLANLPLLTDNIFDPSFDTDTFAANADAIHELLLLDDHSVMKLAYASHSPPPPTRPPSTFPNLRQSTATPTTDPSPPPSDRPPQRKIDWASKPTLLGPTPCFGWIKKTPACSGSMCSHPKNFPHAFDSANSSSAQKAFSAWVILNC